MNHNNIGLPRAAPLPSPALIRKRSKEALKKSSLFILQAKIRAAEREYAEMQEQIGKM